MNRLSLLLSIFLVSLALRIQPITASLNTDEGLWIYRGSLFIKRLLASDLTRTYLKHHPGVPNMWISGSGMLLNCWLHKLFPGLWDLNLPSDISACLSIEQFPINLYIIPRLIQAVITSACMVCIYILTKRLLGQAIALCGITLLLLEPFFLAYQRFLTTDALLANFSTLALLLFLLYLQGEGERKLLLASGAFMGLAVSSKILALLFLPAIVLQITLIELGVWQSSFPPRGWKQQFRDLGWWGATILAVFTLVFPAMWVSPGYVLTMMFRGLLQESDRGFLFFLGQNTDSPGIVFYPLVLAYRLSPVLQVGLLATIAILFIPKLRRRQKKISEIAALAIIPLCVLPILSAFDSKIDRYISNLCIPVLALLAAVGWLEIVGSVRKWRLHRGVTTAIVLFVLQLVFLLPHYPYYLTYYNPLLGGTRIAQHLFMIGQGEGLEKAALWLNQFPNVKEIKVASWYSRYFSTYFQGQTLPIDKRITPGVQPWTQANRVVFYCNQLQRQLPEQKMIAYFSAQQPLYTVRLHDVDYVQVYPGPLPLAEDLKHIQFPTSISFGESVRLLGYDINQSQLSPDEELLVTFYWELLSPPPPDALINIALRDGDGNLTNHSSTPLLNGYLLPEQITSPTILRDVHKLTISPNTAQARYQLAVRWFSPSHNQSFGNQQVIGEFLPKK
jgi:4-amino-4-deoxy-L-arabinose transferase-like glycosyltransferase